MILQPKYIPQSKRKKLADSLQKIDSGEKEKIFSSIKTNRTTINRSQLDLATILKEAAVLNSVLMNLPFYTILCLTQVSTELYKLINDCEEIGLVGVDKIDPSKRLNAYTIFDYCCANFFRINYTPQTIPGIPFCRVMQQVIQLARSYWPYIYKTNIGVIYLAANDLTDNDFVDLCGYLKNSRVTLVYLGYNRITDQGINTIVKEKKLLKGEDLQINLEHNYITESSQELLKSTYSKVTWIF